MTQMLLLPDPRPLVERLGAAFFRNAPDSPGVYLMRGRDEAVLYVGKAKSLRKRLASYRVANPDRLRRRHLRLLRAVEKIELLPCDTESAALANESALLRSLRPYYNRAGTWPGTPRFLAWRSTERGLELALLPVADTAWHSYGPYNAGAIHIRAALARMIWCAFHSHPGVAGLPLGWFGTHQSRVCVILLPDTSQLPWLSSSLRNFFAGSPQALCAWILERTCFWSHPFDLAVREADLETLNQFANHAHRADS
jgi:hypothetical protein